MNSYRPCVAILIMHQGKVLLFERNNHPNNWQLPQGGIDGNETPHQAMVRELKEETGITKIRVVATTKDFLSYKIPPGYQRRRPRYVGQKQMWFLVVLQQPLDSIRLDYSNKAEFSNWKKVPYWYPLSCIVAFKREVYRQALIELSPAALQLGI